MRNSSAGRTRSFFFSGVKSSDTAYHFRQLRSGFSLGSEGGNFILCWGVLELGDGQGGPSRLVGYDEAL